MLVAAVAARSVALAGFGLDSLVEIVASLLVVWQLRELHVVERERRALRAIGVAFLVLAVYIAAQSGYVLVAEPRSHRGRARHLFASAVLLGLSLNAAAGWLWAGSRRASMAIGLASRHG